MHRATTRFNIMVTVAIFAAATVVAQEETTIGQHLQLQPGE
jgi:hypothetical protein